MLRFKSITSRIIFLHVVAIALTSAFMPLAVYFLLKSEAADLQHRSLRDNAELLRRYLVAGEDGGLALRLPADLKELFSQSYGRYAYAIVDGSGRTLFSSREDGRPILRRDQRVLQPVYFEQGRGKANLSGASIPATVEGQPVWIEVAQDLEHRDVLIDDIVAQFFGRVGWITIPILLFLFIIDVTIFRRALRPVLKASEMAERIGPSQTGVRLPLDEMPNEIKPLVRTVNQALDRLGRGIEAQRDFAADAAHELRTPLAILQARIDACLPPPAAKELGRDIARMTHVVGQLLEIAELEAFSVGEADIADLKAVCVEAAEFIAPLALAEKKSLSLEAPDGPVWISGSAEVLFRAVRNVAENAIRHTAAGTSVEISIAEDGSVAILDRGPGIAAAERGLVFQRFWRKDRGQATGAGLGLSIVRRIVEAHRGAIAVEDRPGGGSQFVLRFIRAPGPAPAVRTEAADMP